MAVRPIVKVPDPRLRTISGPVLNFDLELKKLVKDMTDSMKAVNGIGIAAIQIGVPLRVIVLNVGKRRVMINPWTVEASLFSEPSLEGCLSIPNCFLVINRPFSVVVEWTDVTGQKFHRAKLTGLESVCFQHELDHLNGVLMLDKDPDKSFTKTLDSSFETGYTDNVR